MCRGEPRKKRKVVLDSCLGIKKREALVVNFKIGEGKGREG